MLSELNFIVDMGFYLFYFDVVQKIIFYGVMKPLYPWASMKNKNYR